MLGVFIRQRRHQKPRQAGFAKKIDAAAVTRSDDLGGDRGSSIGQASAA
jgi:hypothetical protein